MKIKKQFAAIIFFAILAGMFCLLFPPQRAAAREEGETEVTARVLPDGADPADEPQVSAALPQQTRKAPAGLEDRKTEQGNVADTGDPLPRRLLFLLMVMIVSLLLMLWNGKNSYNAKGI